MDSKILNVLKAACKISQLRKDEYKYFNTEDRVTFMQWQYAYEQLDKALKEIEDILKCNDENNKP